MWSVEIVYLCGEGISSWRSDHYMWRKYVCVEKINVIHYIWKCYRWYVICDILYVGKLYVKSEKHSLYVEKVYLCGMVYMWYVMCIRKCYRWYVVCDALYVGKLCVKLFVKLYVEKLYVICGEVQCDVSRRCRWWICALYVEKIYVIHYMWRR